MKKLLDKQGPKYHFSTDIPDRYEGSSLRILNCTPTQLYLYWNIPQAELAQNNGFLRLFFVGGSSDVHTFFCELSIAAGESSRYVAIPFPHLPVKAVFGIMLDTGVFRPLCSAVQSGAVQDVIPALVTPDVNVPEPVLPTEKQGDDPDPEPKADPLSMMNLVRAQAAVFKTHQNAPSSWCVPDCSRHDR